MHWTKTAKKGQIVRRLREPRSAPAQKENTVKKITYVNLPHTPVHQQAFIKWNTYQMQLFFLIPSQIGFEFQTLRKRFPYDPPLSPFMISPSEFQHLSDKTHRGGLAFIRKACVFCFPLAAALPLCSCSTWEEKPPVKTCWLTKPRITFPIAVTPSPCVNVLAPKQATVRRSYKCCLWAKILLSGLSYANKTYVHEGSH